MGAFLIVPIFGFANAGVAVGEMSLFAPVPLGIVGGPVLRKTDRGVSDYVGCGEARLGRLPQGCNLRAGLWRVAALRIGFTMSLFIGLLAFPSSPELQEDGEDRRPHRLHALSLGRSDHPKSRSGKKLSWWNLGCDPSGGT